MGLDGFIKAKGSKNKAKELLKDLISVVCVISTSAILGCIGRHYGRVTDVLATGVGFILGRKFAEKINSFIFGKA